MNKKTNEAKSFASSGYAPTSRPIILSPTKPEIASKNKAYDLRQILKDRMVEFGTLQSEWSTNETRLRSQADELVSQLRDLHSQGIALIHQEQQRHADEIEQLRQQHQIEILELQTQFSDGLSETEPTEDFEDLDHEIEALKDAIAQVENAPPPSGETDSYNEEGEERIRALEERLDEITQMRDEAINQREEDSKASTQMIEQLIVKNQDDEQQYRNEINNLVDELTKLDRNHASQVDEINTNHIEMKRNTAASLRNTLSRINQLQNNITKKQKSHNKQIQALHDEIDKLRQNLESLTNRQKQQMKEAANASKNYAEEKRKFVAYHRELEMLNSELVRESVEHETLLKELSKMDGVILSQMSSSNSRASSVTYSRNSRF